MDKDILAAVIRPCKAEATGKGHQSALRLIYIEVQSDIVVFYKDMAIFLQLVKGEVEILLILDAGFSCQLTGGKLVLTVLFEDGDDLALEVIEFRLLVSLFLWFWMLK